MVRELLRRLHLNQSFSYVTYRATRNIDQDGHDLCHQILVLSFQFNEFNLGLNHMEFRMCRKLFQISKI